VKGFFGLELLSLSLSEGIQNFEAGAFVQLIINHAKKLEPGAKSVFQYGSFRFCLSKRIPEEWGKIEFKTHVEVFRKPRAQLDLFIKKKCAELLKDARYASSPKTLVIRDLSRESLFRFGEEGQTERVAGFLERNCEAFDKSNLKIFIEAVANGTIDLFEQFNITME